MRGPKSIGKTKGVLGRFKQLYLGTRADALNDAAVNVRFRGQQASRGHFRNKGRGDRSAAVGDKLFSRAEALDREARREEMKHLATSGGTLGLGATGIFSAQRTPLHDYGPKKRKTKTAGLKLADAARRARLVQAALKSKNVIKATAPTAAKKAPSSASAITRHSGHHLVDEVLNPGSAAADVLEEKFRQQDLGREAMRNARKRMGKKHMFDPGPMFWNKNHAKLNRLENRINNSTRAAAMGIGAGTVAGTGIAIHRDTKSKKKRVGHQKAASSEKAKGIKRIGQLLSGSRLKALRAEPTAREFKGQMGQVGAELGEQAKVVAARAGAGVSGAGALAGGGVAVHNRKKQNDNRKVATEEQVRSDARRAAGRTGMIRGGVAGAAIGSLRSGPRGAVLGGATGSLLGRAHGRAAFNKRELANDLHMERALIKAKRDRHDKGQEKKAELELELTDEDIDALYGLAR